MDITFADWLGIPNLQDRAFAFGQWRMRSCSLRRVCLPPEAVGPSSRQVLVGYAWSIWLYRLVLFTGIALTVYHYFSRFWGSCCFWSRSYFSFACLSGGKSRPGGVVVPHLPAPVVLR